VFIGQWTQTVTVVPCLWQDGYRLRSWLTTTHPLLWRGPKPIQQSFILFFRLALLWPPARQATHERLVLEIATAYPS
jgi:hypothetical protein